MLTIFSTLFCLLVSINSYVHILLSRYLNHSSQAWKRFFFKSDPPDAFDPVDLSGIAETQDIISDGEYMKKIKDEINECLDKVSTYVSTCVH